MVLPHHAGKFLHKTKGFFLHDFTLIVSVVGESVIGHGIWDPYHGATCLKLVPGVSNDGPSSSPDLTANQISDGWEDPCT